MLILVPFVSIPAIIICNYSCFFSRNNIPWQYITIYGRGTSWYIIIMHIMIYYHDEHHDIFSLWWYIMIYYHHYDILLTCVNHVKILFSRGSAPHPLSPSIITVIAIVPTFCLNYRLLLLLFLPSVLTVTFCFNHHCWLCLPAFELSVLRI